jgi:hypothetical protein
MSTSTPPPYNAQFSFMSETWATVGWANRPGEDYIWCLRDESVFVIGKNINPTSRFTHQIVPMADIGKTSNWQYDLPPHLRAQEHERADRNVGKRVRVNDGGLEFFDGEGWVGM